VVSSSAKTIFLFLGAFTLPALLMMFVGLIVLESGCDPKFGCKLSFDLFLLVFILPAGVTSLAAAALGVWIFKPDFDSIKVPAAVIGTLSLPLTSLAANAVSSNPIGSTVLTVSYFVLGPLLLCQRYSNSA
jgi:hypothetical protein